MLMSVLNQLMPENVFHFFEEICQIPHGSGNLDAICRYCVRFAEERGLKVLRDEGDNILIWKEASPGYEDREPVVLQGHLDMVCEKTADSGHDFTKDALDLYVEDGFVKARNTTLGGDDGIAVAMILALLDEKDAVHPPIEAVFTADEETGMGGAKALDLQLLKGRKLINIDSEEEGILTVGCAGGISCHTSFPLDFSSREGEVVKIIISGLTGGHSGSEINRQRANALKLSGRLLYEASRSTQLFLMDAGGGGKENVIASQAEILLMAEHPSALMEAAVKMEALWKEEFMDEEPNLSVQAEKKGMQTANVVSAETTKKIVAYLMAAPDGPVGYNRTLPGLVETSLNHGIMAVREGYLTIDTLVRSSLGSKKAELAERLKILAGLCGASFRADNEYPGWAYKKESSLRELMTRTYREMFGRDPEVLTIHAGLECGLFLDKKKDLDCVSFGPDIWDVHSVKERLSIESTERSYEYLKAVLAGCCREDI